MRPYLLAASQMTKMTKPDATSENSQPMLCTTQPRPAVEAELSVAVLRKPHSTKPIGDGGCDAEDDGVDLLRLLRRVVVDDGVEGGVERVVGCEVVEGLVVARRFGGGRRAGLASVS